jgi:hypothetical protein
VDGRILFWKKNAITLKDLSKTQKDKIIHHMNFYNFDFSLTYGGSLHQYKVSDFLSRHPTLEYELFS